MQVQERVLEEPVWRAQAAGHATAVEALTRDRLARRREGRVHPVEDFLFDYYGHRPGQLARWHPGAGVGLVGASERADWPLYAWDGVAARVDLAAYRERRGGTVDFVRRLLEATLERAPRFGCFGMHEWAMVYRAGPEEVRHPWPLRLGPEGTDAVLRAQPVACSHFDAYRFFTPRARPLNRLAPTRETQLAMEQPGCLHAGMDVYRWAVKLGPVVPGELVLAAFRLAREIRELDMRASPYDLTDLGYDPVPVETAEGRSAYAAAQRGFTARANVLRRNLLEVVHGIRSNW